MEVKGKVHEVSPVIQATENLKKRELILEIMENPQYPEYVKFECTNVKTALLDAIRPGSDVEVSFNLKGHPWTDKTGKKFYSNTLQLWRVNVLSAAPTDDDNLPF